MDLMSILSIAVIFLIFIIIVLSLVYLSMTIKQKNAETKPKQSKQQAEKVDTKIKAYKEYSRESIFDFMEFEKIEDNMIVQKNGKKFLMVIECQGINYDLMSEVEKNSVELGFMKTLNTLRAPIQIYVQTRTINLENSIQKYKDRLVHLQEELVAKQNLYKKMEASGKYSEKELRNQLLEVIKQENLCEYGRDVVANTERMSLNKNILRKKYYIVLSYYASTTDNEYLDKDEIRDAAFSELYTRCQSLIRALSSAEVIGRVLDSEELIDLLYNAYNRDDAETFGVNKAQEASYDDLYITAPDVLEKRKRALDMKIEKDALDTAEEAVLFANNQQELREKEENLDDLISELAKQLVDENEQYLGDEITEMAKEHIDKTKKVKGGKANDKKTKTTRSRVK